MNYCKSRWGCLRIVAGSQKVRGGVAVRKIFFGTFVLKLQGLEDVLSENVRNVGNVRKHPRTSENVRKRPKRPKRPTRPKRLSETRTLNNRIRSES